METKRKGEITLAWHRWISKKGPPITVELLEYVGTSLRQGRYQHGRPKPHYFNGKAYIGEIWKAVEVTTGKEVNVTFPHVIESSVTPESTNRHRDDIYPRAEPNLLIDSFQEWINNQVSRKRYPNKNLLEAQRKYYLRLDILKRLYETKRTEGVFLMLRHKETPCLRTFNTLKEWREKNQEEYKQILDYISSEINVRKEYNEQVLEIY